MTGTLADADCCKSGAAAGCAWRLTGLPVARSGQTLGGTFTAGLGLAGANTSDSWDGRTHSDQLHDCMSAQGAVFDSLTEVGCRRRPCRASWPKAGKPALTRKTWTFNLRQGVTSTMAKPLALMM